MSENGYFQNSNKTKRETAGSLQEKQSNILSMRTNNWGLYLKSMQDSKQAWEITLET